MHSYFRVLKKISDKALYILSYLIGIAFSIKSLREPDLWWQIRTGQWIRENGAVPREDVFTNSVPGTEWINIKWGFEVIASWVSDHLGPESVFLLQMIASVAILYFLRKILQLLQIDHPLSFFISSLILWLGIEYRLIGRPEMTSHLLMIVYVYILFLYQKKRSPWIWALIPLQIIWTNMHEAYGMGIVLLGIFVFADFIENRKNIKKMDKTPGLVCLGAMMALLVNPRGAVMLLRPLNIFSQVQENKYTTELSSFTEKDFWQKEVFILLAVGVMVILFVVLKKEVYRKIFNRHFSLFYYLLAIAFMVLGAMAYRNIIFTFLILFPFLALVLFEFLRDKKWPAAPWVAIGIIFYSLIVTNVYYRWVGSRDSYGMQVMSSHNPEGAAGFIRAKNLRSGKCFSDYLSSSYLMWALQPDFKTYIDLRDLDVFSTEFFDRYLRYVNYPEEFHQLDQKENYKYVVLHRLSNPRLHQYLYGDTIYACVFVDPVCAIYEKTDTFPKGDIFSPLRNIEIHPLAQGINTLFNPAFEPTDFEAYHLDLEAARYFRMVGAISLAEQRIVRYLSLFPNHKEALDLKNEIEGIQSKMRK